MRPLQRRWRVCGSLRFVQHVQIDVRGLACTICNEDVDLRAVRVDELLCTRSCEQLRAHRVALCTDECLIGRRDCAPAHSEQVADAQLLQPALKEAAEAAAPKLGASTRFCGDTVRRLLRAGLAGEPDALPFTAVPGFVRSGRSADGEVCMLSGSVGSV